MSPQDEVMMKLICWPLGLLIAFCIFTMAFLIPSVLNRKDPVRYAHHYRVANFFRGWGRILSLVLIISLVTSGRILGVWSQSADMFWTIVFLWFSVMVAVFSLTTILAGSLDDRLFETRDQWERKKPSPRAAVS
jgi:magnesium-transporting ATPase (P-type)